MRCEVALGALEDAQHPSPKLGLGGTRRQESPPESAALGGGLDGVRASVHGAQVLHTNTNKKGSKPTEAGSPVKGW